MDLKSSLTPLEVAELLKITKNTVYELIKRGELPSYKIGKKIRIDMHDVEDYINNQKSNLKSSINRNTNTTPPNNKVENTIYTLSNNISLNNQSNSEIIISGQDILLDILARYIEEILPDYTVLRSYKGSYNGLYDLYNNKVSIASCHLWDGDKDEYNTDVNWYTDLITESLGPKWRPIRGNEDCMRINKISAKMIKGCDAEAACRELSEYYDIIRHESGSGIAGTTIELVPKGFNKAVGISAVCRLFDVPWEDTIVFGDSNNDLAMFEYAAVKVAMGNGSEKIKALADHITQDMFHYGIRNGLEYLKLI